MYGSFPWRPQRKNLRALVAEMQVTLQRVKGEALMRIDTKEKSVRMLKRKIIGLAHTIYESTDDTYLKGVVNSVFDSASVEETLAELIDLNNGYRPKKIFSTED